MEKLYLTQPYLPPLEDFIPYLKSIWDSKWLTNNGAFHQEFEEKLKEFLGVNYLSLFANGTLALVTALQALKISGEVITTPFSFAATTHSIWWNGIKPVFVDIEPDTFNLDADKIESAITPQTTAIMPVHIFGNPCNVDKIQRIADIYGLRVIYDACHAFGVKINGQSILNFGDISVISFHATKVFTTFEGGAIICHDEKTKKRIDYLKNFGFADEVTVVAPGINAKMNEFQAALGILQLKHFNKVINGRKKAVKLYKEKLKSIEGIKVLDEKEDVEYNYSYMPILIENNNSQFNRDEIYSRLRENNIYARRYFYPLISNFPSYRGLPSASKENLPVANEISESILCLPIFDSISEKEIDAVIKILEGE